MFKKGFGLAFGGYLGYRLATIVAAAINGSILGVFERIKNHKYDIENEFSEE